jgi:L-arabinonolactonase
MAEVESGHLKPLISPPELLQRRDAQADAPPSSMSLYVGTKCLVGEALTWDEVDNCLWWLDINGKQLFRLDWVEQKVYTSDLPKRASALALRNAQGGSEQQRPDLPLLIAFEDGFALFSHKTGEAMYIPSPYTQHSEDMRLNDGRCDRQGRFICGGVNLHHIDEALDIWLPTQSTYQIIPGGAARLLLAGPYRCYNSTCFSPSGTVMYMSDTPEGVIMAYDYDPLTGDATNPREFVHLSPPGKPDGATCDAQGAVWVAEFWAGQVTKFSQKGERVASYKTQGALRTTCCCIGGPELNILFATTACVGLSNEEKQQQSGAGGLFAMALPAIDGSHGLPEPKYAG